MYSFYLYSFPINNSYIYKLHSFLISNSNTYYLYSSPTNNSYCYYLHSFPINNRYSYYLRYGSHVLKKLRLVGTTFAQHFMVIFPLFAASKTKFGTTFYDVCINDGLLLINFRTIIPGQLTNCLLAKVLSINMEIH